MRLIRSTLALLTLTILLAPATVDATAPDTTRTVDREVLMQEQMAILLQEDNARQEQAIQLIAHYAHTGRYEASFFYPLVDPLLDVVTSSEVEELRIMAISALYSIGSESAMNTLARRLPLFESESVEAMARRALVQYTLDQASGETPRVSTRLPDPTQR